MFLRFIRSLALDVSGLAGSGVNYLFPHSLSSAPTRKKITDFRVVSDRSAPGGNDPRQS